MPLRNAGPACRKGPIANEAERASRATKLPTPRLARGAQPRNQTPVGSSACRKAVPRARRAAEGRRTRHREHITWPCKFSPRQSPERTHALALPATHCPRAAFVGLQRCRPFGGRPTALMSARARGSASATRCGNGVGDRLLSPGRTLGAASGQADDLATQRCPALPSPNRAWLGPVRVTTPPHLAPLGGPNPKLPAAWSRRLWTWRASVGEMVLATSSPENAAAPFRKRGRRQTRRAPVWVFFVLLVLSAATAAAGGLRGRRAAVAMPAACQAASSSSVAAAQASFDVSNKACTQGFRQCVAANTSVCAAECTDNVARLGHDCRAGQGSFCRYQALSRTAPLPGRAPFVFRSAMCVPSTCGPPDADAVQAALRDTLCGVGASADCQVVLTCDFGLSSGAVLGIVAGVIAAFCLIVVGGVCCARCEAEDDDFTDAHTGFRSGRRDSDGSRGFRIPSFAIMAAKEGSDEDCIENMAGRVPAKGFTSTATRRCSDATASWIACSDHSATICEREAASARDDFLLTAEGRGLRAHGDDGL